MCERTVGRWWSAHLYFDGELYGKDGDALLRIIGNVVTDVRKANLVDRWFFVRYGQGGPHIRLRLHGRDEEGGLAIRQILVNYGLDCNPRSSTSVSVGARRELRTTPCHSLQWVPYEPEVLRYGGPNGMRLAEEVFGTSSDVALDLLKRINGQRNARLGQGLLCLLTTMHVFCDGPLHLMDLARFYTNGYLTKVSPTKEMQEHMAQAFTGGLMRQEESLIARVTDVWERLDHQEALSNGLDRLREDMLAYRARLAVLVEGGRIVGANGAIKSMMAASYHIVPSYIHMTNNRLGISIVEEAYLSHIVRAVGERLLSKAQVT